ncbi:hypothetical protein GCM10010435_90640 [Winogradskya consettensis]|uniref:Uncharacterized protein n=1 Tax=Winogradskya consettensis TaxID=113560 RepID=A0A919VZ16_9ACTN|nr:hypothetical protein Aco04nite_68270 [Actinoplanes consettensis]
MIGVPAVADEEFYYTDALEIVGVVRELTAEFLGEPAMTGC